MYIHTQRISHVLESSFPHPLPIFIHKIFGEISSYPRTELCLKPIPNYIPQDLYYVKNVFNVTQCIRWKGIWLRIDCSGFDSEQRTAGKYSSHLGFQNDSERETKLLPKNSWWFNCYEIGLNILPSSHEEEYTYDSCINILNWQNRTVNWVCSPLTISCQYKINHHILTNNFKLWYLTCEKKKKKKRRSFLKKKLRLEAMQKTFLSGNMNLWEFFIQSSPSHIHM